MRDNFNIFNIQQGIITISSMQSFSQQKQQKKAGHFPHGRRNPLRTFPTQTTLPKALLLLLLLLSPLFYHRSCGIPLGNSEIL